MSVDAKVSLALPEGVELPARFGRLTRMRATWVEAYAYSRFGHSHIHTSLRGPGIKKDGTDAAKGSYFSVTERENGEHFHLIPEAEWAVIRRAQAMVQAMLDAAREVEEAAA